MSTTLSRRVEPSRPRNPRPRMRFSPYLLDEMALTRGDIVAARVRFDDTASCPTN
jgi:hypothetical protein